MCKVGDAVFLRKTHNGVTIKRGGGGGGGGGMKNELDFTFLCFDPKSSSIKN